MTDDVMHCIESTMFLSLEKQKSFGPFANKGLKNGHYFPRLSVGNQYQKDAI